MSLHFQGHIYAANQEFHLHERGWLGLARGQLLYKSAGRDHSGVGCMAVVVDVDTLKEIGSVEIPVLGRRKAVRDKILLCGQSL